MMPTDTVHILAQLTTHRRVARRWELLPCGIKISVGCQDFMSKIFNE
jgi:hypothetical protein